jgi:hypothetical protein
MGPFGSLIIGGLSKALGVSMGIALGGVLTLLSGGLLMTSLRNR